MPDRDEAISSGQPFARLGPPQSATGQKMAAENLLRAAKNVSPARLSSLAEDLRHELTAGNPRASTQPGRGANLPRPNEQPRAGVVVADLVEWLTDVEGLDVTRRKIVHAVRRGRIPPPFATGSTGHSWRVEDVPAVAAYFRNPAPIGRPRKVR